MNDTHMIVIARLYKDGIRVLTRLNRDARQILQLVAGVDGDEFGSHGQ